MFERRLLAIAPLVGGLVAAVTAITVLRADCGNPTTRILEWNWVQDRGKVPYVREIGKGFDEFHAIRIDEDDNIWAVAPTANEVYKFSPAGELLLRFGAPPVPDGPTRLG